MYEPTDEQQQKNDDLWQKHLFGTFIFFVFEHSFAKRNCNTVSEREREQKAKQINGSFYIL